MTNDRVEVLWLSQEDVVAAGGLDMVATMADVEAVFRLHAAKDYALPEKIVMAWQEPPPGEQGNHINFMPGYAGGAINAVGVKAIASFPQNPLRHGLPRASALVVLNDPEVGLPLAVMDDTLISAMRTGAASGVGIKYLAGKDVTQVGLIGAGVQCRTQLMAVQVARPGIRSARIFDIRRDRAEGFAAEMGDRLNLQIEVAESAEAVVRWAEVLVTATTTNKPIVGDGWLQPGTTYAHVSGYECEYDVVRRADKIVVDDWVQVQHRMYSTIALMWRDGEFSDDDIYAELGEIVSGQKPGRERADERIIFSPIGMGLHDLAVAKRIYENAVANGIGQKVALWDEPMWV